MTKILLVEDNPLNQDMLSRRLKRQSYEVVIAVDGAAALSMAKTEEPDVILMDMNIPIIDGWEATRRLKADVQTQQIPVIALTAYAMMGDREKAIAAGCNDYATKPVEFKQLLKTLRSFAPQPTSAGQDRPIVSQTIAPDLAPATTPAIADPSASIASESTPQNGSQPQAIPTAITTPVQPAAATPAAPAPDLPFTLLVVNDNVTNREILGAHLQRRGYTVVKVDSPSATLDVLNEFSIDLVLLDIMVPDSGNFNLLQQIRKTHSKTDLSVILITINDSDEDVVKAFDAGANDYVSKPINLAIVMARIKSQLENLQANRQLRSDLQLGATEPPVATTPLADTPSPALNGFSAQSLQALEGNAPTPVGIEPPVNQPSVNQPSVTQFSITQASIPQSFTDPSNNTRTSATQSLSTFVSSYKPYFLGHIFAQTPFSQVKLTRRSSELEAVSDNPLCFVETFSFNPKDDTGLTQLRTLLSSERSRLESISQNNRILGLIDFFENDEAFGWYQSYVEGRLFAEELSAGQIFPPQKVLSTIKELLEMLLPFHTRKIVHASMQPQHLWRCSGDGELRLLNLGLSRRLINNLRDHAARGHSVLHHPAFNHEHDYMPIEQRIGQAVLSSDLYAVGLIALQLLTGKQPSVLTNSLIASETSLEHLALVPPEMQPLLAKMVAQNHQARYPSALAALKGLNELMSPLPSS